jgi:hypothetical protein
MKDGMSRMKYKDLGVNPETGKRRRLAQGLMTDEEYEAYILGLNGAEDDPNAVAGLPVLDDPDAMWDAVVEEL